MLELPKGIYFPTKEDVCSVPGMEAEYESAKKAFEENKENITNGYVISESDDPRFKFAYEVNIDASRLWDFFWDISEAMFGELDDIYCIYGLKDEEMQLTDYKPKEYIKSVLEKYKYSIVHDGFLSVGVAFDKEIIEEVFIESYKYIRILTTQKNEVESVLAKYDLHENTDIRFIDEFIVASETVEDKSNGILHPDDIVEELSKAFE